MFLHPLSQALGFTAPNGKGIYVLPFSEKVPNGWGDPRIKDGKPVTPGTPGGENPVAHLRKANGGVKVSASKFFQKAGNITWWGKAKSSTRPAIGKHVLSYNGPVLRYFPEKAFVYGDKPEHNEIYYQGNYAAIAPGPVAGACIRKAPHTDPTTDKTEEKTFIFVAVARPDKDEFYRRLWEYTVIPSYNMTDAIRSAEKLMYDAMARPTGWQKVGEFMKPSDDHFKTETPWFFNESGTEAVTTRRRRITFNNGHEDVTEDAFDRLKATVTNDNVSVQNLGNNAPMQYEEKVTKEHPTHTSTDYAGFSHTWQEDHVRVDISLEGSQYVLGDYRGDVLHWGKIDFNIKRTQRVYYTKGTDDASYIVDYLGSPKNISNRDLRVGPYYHDIYEYGYTRPGYVPEEGDHEYTQWSGVRESIRLLFGPDSAPETYVLALHGFRNGTSDEWEDNPYRDENPDEFFYEFATRYLRALVDLREKPVSFGYEYRRYGLRQGSVSMRTRTTEHRDGLFTDSDKKPEFYTSVRSSDEKAYTTGWPIAEMDSWDETISATLSRTTYEGVWTKDNAEAELQVPGNRTYYGGAVGEDYKESWPSIPKLFYDEKNLCKGNGVRTEREETCFSVEVPDPETPGKYVVLSDHKTGGKLPAVVGYGEKFYPVGAC